MTRISLQRTLLACLCCATAAVTGCGASHPASQPGSGPSTAGGAASASPAGAATPRTTQASSAGGGSAVPSCESLTPLVTTALHTTTQLQHRQVNGPVTICLYSDAAGSSPLVRFQTGQSAAAYTSARARFDANGRPTTDLPGLGDAAYTSAGNAVAAPSVVVLKGTTELLVTSAGSLADCKAVATAILPAL